LVRVPAGRSAGLNGDNIVPARKTPEVFRNSLLSISLP
jgi:hypothetical protein